MLFCTAVVLLLVACNARTAIPQVAREDLFSLDIGRLEDQVAMFNLEGDRGMRQTSMVMRDGFFYISDGEGGKILRFNSYGDLLFMIYNEDTNPPPLSLKPLQPDNLVTRWATPYPLQEPGALAVDSRKHIYVTERLPYERHGLDTESRAYLDSVILHFDADGRFLEYLGRDGIGGSPFPHIEALYNSANDDLAVVCRVPTGWNVYWFDLHMNFLFMIQLKDDAIPVPPDRDMVIPSLDTIAVAPDSRKLYVKVDYYRDTYDESTNTRTGYDPDSSVIWIMDVESGAWESRSVEVPFLEYTYTERNRQVTTRVLYSMMGVVNEGRVFLSFPVEGGYSLLLLSTAGPVVEQRQRFIRVDNSELHFNTFSLSADGILSGLLVDEWKVKLVWWRTDRLSD